MAEEPLLYDIRRAGELLSLSRAKLYLEMDAGRLKWVKIGKKRLIRATDLHAYIDSLQPEYTETEQRMIEARRATITEWHAWQRSRRSSSG